MFTGIVERTGKVVSFTSADGGGDDPARAREQQARALDKHHRLHALLRHTLDAELVGDEPVLGQDVPQELELLGIPYTGAGPGCLAVCYDKSMVR